MIITTTDGSTLPSEEALVAALGDEFGRNRVTALPITSPMSKARFHIEIQPDGEPPFAVRQLVSGGLSSDGTATQNVRVAAGVSALLPANSPRVVAIDESGSRYVDLVPGITLEQVERGWRDVAEGGF